MLTKYIIDGAKVLLLQFCKMTGAIVPLPDWASTALNYLFNAIRSASGLITWIIPNETIYYSLVGIALGIVTAWLISKIVGFAIRLYDLLLVQTIQLQLERDERQFNLKTNYYTVLNTTCSSFF